MLKLQGVQESIQLIKKKTNPKRRRPGHGGDPFNRPRMLKIYWLLEKISNMMISATVREVI